MSRWRRIPVDNEHDKIPAPSPSREKKADMKEVDVYIPALLWVFSCRDGLGAL